MVEELFSKIRRNPRKWFPLVLLILLDGLFSHRVFGWANEQLDKVDGPVIAQIHNGLAFMMAHFWVSMLALIAAYSAGLAIIAHVSVWRTAWVSKRNPAGPILQFGPYAYAGNWSSEDLRRPQVLDVRNIQTAIENTARNVTARIVYLHDDGTTFTVKTAPWLVAEEVGTISHTGIRNSVNLVGNASQPFVFLSIHKDGSFWAYESNFKTPSGICGTGHWLAKIKIISDNAKAIEETIGFTAMPDKALRYDDPAFASHADESARR